MARRWWPFGGKSEAAEQPAGDSPASAAGSDRKPPDVPAAAAGAALQRQPDAAPPSPATRGGRPAGDRPTAADVQTGNDFRRELASDLWTNSRPGLLGDDGGLGETAVFLREATGIADSILRKPIAQEVLRTVDTQLQSADGSFANSLPTLMSYSDTDALMSGEPLDMPFGDREPPESFADRVSSDVELPRFGPAQPPPAPVPLNVATGQRQTVQPSAATAGLMRTPDMEIELPRGRPRRFDESPAREPGAAPETPLVVRSVPAREFREGASSPAAGPIGRLPDESHPPMPMPAIPNDISGTVASIETFRGPRPAVRAYAPQAASDIPRSAPSGEPGPGSALGAATVPTAAPVQRAPAEIPSAEPQATSKPAAESETGTPSLPLGRAIATEEPGPPANATLPEQARGEGLPPLELELARPAGIDATNVADELQNTGSAGAGVPERLTISRLAEPGDRPSSVPAEALTEPLLAESQASAAEGEARTSDTLLEGAKPAATTAPGGAERAPDTASELPASEIEDPSAHRIVPEPAAAVTDDGSGFDELEMPFTLQGGGTPADTAEASTGPITRHPDTATTASSSPAPAMAGPGTPEPQPPVEQVQSVPAAPPGTASSAAPAALERAPERLEPGTPPEAPAASSMSGLPGRDEKGGMISRLVAEPEEGASADGAAPRAPISMADPATAYAPIDLEMAEAHGDRRSPPGADLAPAPPVAPMAEMAEAPGERGTQPGAHPAPAPPVAPMADIAEAPGERGSQPGADAALAPPVAPMDEAAQAGSGAPTQASSNQPSGTDDVGTRSVARMEGEPPELPLTATEDPSRMEAPAGDDEAVAPPGAVKRRAVSPTATGADTFAPMSLPLAERGERALTPGDLQEAGAPKPAPTDSHQTPSPATPTSLPSSAGEPVAQAAERAAGLPISRTGDAAASAATSPPVASSLGGDGASAGPGSEASRVEEAPAGTRPQASGGDEAAAGTGPEASLPFALPDDSGSPPGVTTGDAGAAVPPLEPRVEADERPALEFASAGQIGRSTDAADVAPDTEAVETVREASAATAGDANLPFAEVRRLPDNHTPAGETAAPVQGERAPWPTPELPHSIPHSEQHALGARSAAEGAPDGRLEPPGPQRQASPAASSGPSRSPAPTVAASGATPSIDQAPEFVMRRADRGEPAATSDPMTPATGDPRVRTTPLRAVAEPLLPNSEPPSSNAAGELPLAVGDAHVARTAAAVPLGGESQAGPQTPAPANSPDSWPPLPFAEPAAALSAESGSTGSPTATLHRDADAAYGSSGTPIARAGSSGGAPGPAIVHRLAAAPSGQRMAGDHRAASSAAPLPLATVSASAPETLSHAPVEMPLATQPHPVQRLASGGATQHEATGMIVERELGVDGASPAPGEQQPQLSIEEIKEQVWQYIRRELRIERERSRGYT